MDALIPYLPTDRVHALAAGRELPDRTHGSALFVDISGFTPLAEALANDLGPQRGAEELTFFLNQVYSVLIAELDRYRGSVIGFSGDAITCWLEADHGTAAVACALSMQETMEQFSAVPLPSGGTIQLAAKAGIAVGPARRFVVGNPEHQLIDVLAGELLDEMASAEHEASAGDVVLAPSAVDSLRTDVKADHRLGEKKSFLKIDSLLHDVDTNPWPTLPPEALTDEQLHPWLLRSVYERLRDGQGEFLAELRPAVALFFKFDGLDYDGDDEAGSKLDALVQRVQEILAKYDGTLVDITTGDKGSHLYIAFGAPRAHEDDLERAASAALDLRTVVEKFPFITNVEMGMSRGRLRTGAYGGKTRRTYGALGDATNLAARLMQAALPGEILVSEFASDPIDSAFEWDFRSPITAKGKSEPVAVRALVGLPAGLRSAVKTTKQLLPMVGREEELSLALDKLKQAAQGDGQIVGITAPAGMGKSRLLAEIVYSAIAEGSTVYRGETKSYGMNSAYLVWESIWRDFFAIDSSQTEESQIDSVHERLEAIDPRLAARVPLLGPVLNLSVPETTLTKSFDAKLRKTSLEALLVGLVKWRASQGPLVLVLEDTHWIDPLSRDLLKAIGHSAAGQNVIILLTYRISEDGISQPELQDLAHFTQIELSSLSKLEAGQWIDLKVRQLYGSGRVLPERFSGRLIERADGHPFYIEEVLNYLKDHQIQLDDLQALNKVELPGSLHSLVLTRIDQLGERPRTALKVASVIGRSFRAPEIRGAYPEFENWDVTLADLKDLAHKGFLDMESADEQAYLFKHSVIQEVAYETMPFDTRAALHGKFGGYLERNYADSVEQHLDSLAFHFDRSLNEDKKREYLLKAGEAAQENYANSAAVEYYGKVVKLVSPEDQIEILLKLGQVFEMLGEWEEAHSTYRSVLEIAEDQSDSEAGARAEAAIGELLRKKGDYSDALVWLEQARSTFDSLGEEAGSAQVLHFSGTLAAQQGEYELAAKRYEESLTIRRRLDDKRSISSTLNNLGIVARYEGDLERALSLYEESLTLRRELDDRWAVATSLNNQGNLYVDLGELDGARSRLEEAVSLLEEIGDRWYYANALNNLGNVGRSQANYSEARSLYNESLDINRELGDGWALAYLLEDIASLNASEGREEDAYRLLGAAQSQRERIGAPLPPPEQEKLEKHFEQSCTILTAESQEHALESGRTMTLEQAIEFAETAPN